VFAVSLWKEKDRGTSVISLLPIAQSWQGEDVKPSEMAARFAAFAWYTEDRRASSRIAQQEARQFSSQSWQFFLPVAHDG
jgi:hypothetical protein